MLLQNDGKQHELIHRKIQFFACSLDRVSYLNVYMQAGYFCWKVLFFLGELIAIFCNRFDKQFKGTKAPSKIQEIQETKKGNC